MKVLIASVRAPKVNGVKRAFRKLSDHADFKDILFEPMQIDSGVNATPLSIEVLLTGARQRAEAAMSNERGQSKGTEPVYSVGLEGGVSVFLGRAFLQSWACVFDSSRMSFGSSGSIEIPQALADAVLRGGADLGEVIDVFAEELNVRSNQGTWGILTNDLITREDSFELATLNALAPFFNGRLYARRIPG
jgi:non-canonical (house-cleaning) NTP pyrophosphatase